MRINKRGAGHVEFILAVVLFITIVGGALIFLNPAKSSRTVESSLSYTFNEIEDYAGTQLEIYNVNIESISSGENIAIPLSATIDENKEKVRVESSSGSQIIPYGVDENKVYFNYGASEIDGKHFAVIKFNEEFNSGALFSGSDGVYEISSSSKRRVISENKMELLKGSYAESGGYESLRTQFNLPGNDFAFSLVFADGTTINPPANIPSGLDVFTDSKRVEVLRIDGTLTFAELIVTVW